jgi:hypothetical protein
VVQASAFADNARCYVYTLMNCTVCVCTGHEW